MFAPRGWWWKLNLRLRIDMFCECVYRHVLTCVMALCCGLQPGSSAVYSLLCSMRLVDRAPTALVLMRLADYCNPSPSLHLCPLLSTLQPCKANPDQAGPSWSVITMHTYIHSCLRFSRLVAWINETHAAHGSS